MKPVTVSLHDLETNNISHSTLLEAFGPTSLGILIVSDLPSSFSSLRSKVLTNASHLASLPAPAIEDLTNPDAKYLVGWSHGKETLRPGVVDTLKGSYYINCSFYNTNDPSKTAAQDATTWPGFEEYTAPSVWPDNKDIPKFQEDTEALIRLIIDTAVLVARQCDRFAQKEIEHYEPGYLERMVKSSRTTKGRLLHYFPSENSSSSNGTATSSMTSTSQNHKSDNTTTRNGTEAKDDDTDNDTWCATHLDHGCLTGLTSAQYIDESTSLVELPSSPSPTAGLYIRDRSGTTHKVAIPRDCLAFQTGEALELITQGKFKAVPHFVRGVEKDEEGLGHVARNTLAVFTQPNLGEVVDTRTGLTFGEFARGVVRKNTAG